MSSPLTSKGSPPPVLPRVSTPRGRVSAAVPWMMPANVSRSYPPALVDGNPVKAWKRMDSGQRSRLLRSLIECVIVAPVGRGKRVPLADRARVIKYGTGLVQPYRGGGVVMPIRSLVLPQSDDPVVLRV